VDLVGNPDLVATDPVVSFRTAFWFWMTAQPPKPSCHAVATGQWTPTAAATTPRGGRRLATWRDPQCHRPRGWSAGWEEFFSEVDRIGYYKRYCDMLGVGYGSNLDYYN
jgi:chitinase